MTAPKKYEEGDNAGWWARRPKDVMEGDSWRKLWILSRSKDPLADTRLILSSLYVWYKRQYFKKGKIAKNDFKAKILVQGILMTLRAAYRAVQELEKLYEEYPDIRKKPRYRGYRRSTLSYAIEAPRTEPDDSHLATYRTQLWRRYTLGTGPEEDLVA